MLKRFSTMFDRSTMLINNERGKAFAYIDYISPEPSHIVGYQSSFLDGFPSMSPGHLSEYKENNFPKVVIAPGIADKARAAGLLTTAEVYTLSDRVYNDPTIQTITMKDLIRESDWPSPKEAVEAKLKLYIQAKVR